MPDVSLIITISKPTQAEIDDIVDNVTTEMGYNAMVPDGNGGEMANPQSKKQFVEERIIEFLKAKYKNQKNRAANSIVLSDTDTAFGGVSGT